MTDHENVQHVHEQDNLVEITSELVSAYVSNNALSKDDVPGFITSVAEALQAVSSNRGSGGIGMSENAGKPAVPVKKSLHADHIVCLEDGLSFKSLKRHLRAHHNLSPEEYRKKWDLPADYPMVAPDYAVRRSELAKENKLGKVRS